MLRLAKSLKLSLASAVERYNPNIDQAAAYLEARGIDLEYARQCGLGVVSGEDDLTRVMPGLKGRLAIPYLTPAGPRQMSFRCIKDHNCKEVPHAKYLPFPGMTDAEKRQSKRLYFVLSYQTAGATMCLTEGEIDALTLNMLGIPAMGVPGAENWQSHWTAVFEDFSSILVFRDGDVEKVKPDGSIVKPASDKFVSTIIKHLGSKVRVIKLPDGEDVNSVYVKEGYDALLGYMRK